MKRVVGGGATNGRKGHPRRWHRRNKPDGSREPLPGCAQVVLAADERMISISCGGGYGPPHERAPEKVLHDVREKWISRERARDTYLVAVSDDLSVDAAATAALRQRSPRPPNRWRNSRAAEPAPIHMPITRE